MADFIGYQTLARGCLCIAMVDGVQSLILLIGGIKFLMTTTLPRMPMDLNVALLITTYFSFAIFQMVFSVFLAVGVSRSKSMLLQLWYGTNAVVVILCFIALIIFAFTSYVQIVLMLSIPSSTISFLCFRAIECWLVSETYYKGSR